ncbi:MAG: DM13 domain-containing protein [Pontiella sp.]
MRTGELKGSDAEHPASGKIVVDGSVIKLEEVNITEAPDGRVILAKNYDEGESVQCGNLKGFTGSHEYAIPEGTNVGEFDTVVLWCDQFSVPIGQAGLS